jgi:L,D-transpeptidase ErfK/SrfK
VALRLGAAGLLSALLLLAARGAAAVSPQADPTVVGGDFSYSVERGDSLAIVSARFGVDAPVIAADNGLAPDARLRIGQTLRVTNRHLIPGRQPEGIRINIPQRMLFEYDGESVRAYPVGLGRPDWQTPTGRFAIAGKERHPVWDVPISIQEEMRREGKPVRERVPPGPNNPLGDYWMSLTGSACGIHGTNAPSSVYRFRTHGCIRLHPDDVADLFPRVPVGLPVEIVYQPVLLAAGAEGAVWLEVHADVYRRGIDPFREARDLAARAGVSDRIDWTRAGREITASAGVARRVEVPTTSPRLDASPGSDSTGGGSTPQGLTTSAFPLPDRR